MDNIVAIISLISKGLSRYMSCIISYTKANIKIILDEKIALLIVKLSFLILSVNSSIQIKNHVADIFGIIPNIKLIIELLIDCSLKNIVILQVIIPIIPKK